MIRFAIALKCSTRLSLYRALTNQKWRWFLVHGSNEAGAQPDPRTKSSGLWRWRRYGPENGAGQSDAGEREQASRLPGGQESHGRCVQGMAGMRNRSVVWNHRRAIAEGADGPNQFMQNAAIHALRGQEPKRSNGWSVGTPRDGVTLERRRTTRFLRRFAIDPDSRGSCRVSKPTSPWWGLAPITPGCWVEWDSCR